MTKIISKFTGTTNVAHNVIVVLFASIIIFSLVVLVTHLLLFPTNINQVSFGYAN